MMPPMNVQAQVSELIDQMRVAAKLRDMTKYRTVSDSLEVLLRASTEPVGREFSWNLPGISPQQRRILGLLHSRLGKVTSRDAMLSAIYFDVDDRPEGDQKTLGVHIYKIRHSLKRLGQPFAIETVKAFGYKMVRA